MVDVSQESWQRARTHAAANDWLLTAGVARGLGLTAGEVANRARRGECMPLLRGVYLLDPELYDDLPARTLYRAALLSHVETDACLYGATAVRWAGVEGMPAAETTVEVALLSGTPRAPRLLQTPRIGGDGPRVVVRQVGVSPDEVAVHQGLPLRAARWSVVDAALDLDRPHALSVLDSALRRGLVAPDELQVALARAKGRPGVQQLRPLVGLADGRAESPLESRIRLICVDGDVPPDDLQFAVRDHDGHVLAIGDLAWTRRRRPLLAEADGAGPHSLPQAVFRDRRRGNVLVPGNVDTVRFAWADAARPAYVLYVVRSALAA